MTEKAKPKASDKPKQVPDKESQDAELEQELEDSFPASDPPSLTQPRATAGAPDHKGRKGK